VLAGHQTPLQVNAVPIGHIAVEAQGLQAGGLRPAVDGVAEDIAEDQGSINWVPGWSFGEIEAGEQSIYILLWVDQLREPGVSYFYYHRLHAKLAITFLY
jgi:hypothetical protein